VFGAEVLVGLGMGLAVKVGREVTVGVIAGFLVAVAVAAGGLVGGTTVALTGEVGDARVVGIVDTDVCVAGTLVRLEGTV